jgi:hypothetical protein
MAHPAETPDESGGTKNVADVYPLRFVEAPICVEELKRTVWLSQGKSPACRDEEKVNW